MTKNYEKKAVNATLVMVDFDTQIEKREKGTFYEGTNIIYKAFGKVNEKGLTTKTFEYQKQLRGQLEALTPRDDFTMHMYREVGGQFWNIDSVTPGHVQEENTSGAVRGGTASKGGAKANDFVNPAAVGQAMNLAVQLGECQTYDTMRNPDAVRNAIKLYKESKDMFTRLWDEKPRPAGDEEFPNEEDMIPF